MFDDDLAALSTADLLGSAGDCLAVENRAAVRGLEVAMEYADRFHPDVCPLRLGRHSGDGGERAVVLGGDGCPPVAQFAIAEFGAVRGVSPGVAGDYIGSALALRCRFPFTWARVLAGDVTPWKARLLTKDCLNLSLEAALYVDQRVAHLLDTISPWRLAKIIKAAKIHADPGRARAEADAKDRERGVFVGGTDDHGTKTCVIKAPVAAVNRHEARIAELAEALRILGDKRSLQERRAAAVGIIPDFRFAEELLAQAREHERANPAVPRSAPVPSPTQTPTEGPPAATSPSTTGSPAPAPATGLRLVGSTGSDTAADDRPGDDLRDAWGSSDCVTAPGPDDEADRDAPHPSTSELCDPLDMPFPCLEPFDTSPRTDTRDGDDDPMTAAERRALDARLAQIRHDAYARPPGQRPGQPRPGKTELYIHLTDQTLIAAAKGVDGVVRAEGVGPLLLSQLPELIGHGPYLVKPVIDLNNAISSDAYEASDRIREHVKLIHPVELFPYGTRETNHSIDLDHIEPYDPLGPPGQTNTQNLAPLSRYGHRVKTHAPGWKLRRIDAKTLEWTTPHGFVFRVDPTGTHRVPKEAPDG